MKILKPEEWENLTWIAVYRNEVELEYNPYLDDENYPCVELLVPTETLKQFLREHNMTWRYHMRESITDDYNGLYEFAKDKIVAMRYCK